MYAYPAFNASSFLVYTVHFFSLPALDCMQCLELMRQSNFSAVAITDGTTSNKLIGNFSVSDLRSVRSMLISVHS